MTGAALEPYVFNVVWTGSVFDYLQVFVASLVDNSSARFRFVANCCPVDQIAAMEAFADRWPGRVVEVLPVASDLMLRHGEALDAVLRTRDDGEFFCLIDPDILARGSFLARFTKLLGNHVAVTAGSEVWSDHNVMPAGELGVKGEYFFDYDGFTFGSPHLALYRAEALRTTTDRWEIGFGSTGNDLQAPARDRLAEFGHSYWVYDTGKIVNILLQADGHALCHEEDPALVHIGGVSHFLAPPSTAPAARDRPVRWGEGADWGTAPDTAVRYEFARVTATVVAELVAGRPAPEIPANLDPSVESRLTRVRELLIQLVAKYGPGTSTFVEPTP